MANEVGHHAKLSELEKNMQCPLHKLEILARGKEKAKEMEIRKAIKEKEN